MDRTGSIAIARAVLGGRGILLTLTGFLVLIASAIAHATPAHLAAALVFGLGMAALRILAKHDLTVLGTPWAGAIRLTDYLSLTILAVATFGPLFIVATGGHPGWDVPVLAGILAVWWSALDILIADYRRIRVALFIVASAWTPIVFLHPSVEEIAFVVIALAVMALTFSAWSIRRAMLDVPRYYRIMDVNPKEQRP